MLKTKVRENHNRHTDSVFSFTGKIMGLVKSLYVFPDIRNHVIALKDWCKF